VRTGLDSGGIGLGRLQDRLLLVPGAFAQDTVQAKPDKQGNQRENDDNGQLVILFETKPQHSACSVKIPTLRTHEAAIAPKIRDC
jgi:tRNA/tmRNA/rRNA uracil-C5-methylase (TrmA/RlmC/RlmD family)